ncbi:Paired amphipathic helix (PAH2) superfamily protein [Arabidopsis thaliana]|uniref:At1g24230 n=1 Tax=Arabidopsis thaliana TaxID=3702 RepID=B2GVM8_ARATH|nr:Paired amphipathic helix (PAH2) superfamily protein [Arabidopsis thaliana]ACB88829.1 At1g24230 [Arabidopsis thaliana]AEE30498.1 Paired amphipathic helix (PAH2) superfamily protein [Arabidopsis thaliana]|eukprot:NP_173833.1 Paired amphipathic helix (PAH2) superfamily protein [Arabidopsis thaliana]
MVGGSLSPAFTIDEATSYINAVKEAFGADQPAKYREFLDIMLDLRANRVDLATVVPRMRELLKDHVNLLLRFNAFLPAEAKETFHDVRSYIYSLKESFRDEPAKYAQFLEILNDYSARRVDAPSAVARMTELMKDHRNLVLGFSVLLSTGDTKTTPLEAEPDNNKRIRVANFISKLKARFQGNDGHVYESFLEILTMYQQGNKSVNDLYQEVVALLQGHEDLVMEFSNVFKRTTGPSGSKSARDR